MHNRRYAIVLLLFGLVILIARTPAPLNAQPPSQAAILQATSESQPPLTTEDALPTPVSPEESAPIGDNTRQALLIAGGAFVITLLIGGGIYLRRWWLANRW